LSKIFLVEILVKLRGADIFDEFFAGCSEFQKKEILGISEISRNFLRISEIF
jgi:hypothetical protein